MPGARAAGEQIAEDLVGLHGRALDQVAIHRGGGRSAFLGHHRPHGLKMAARGGCPTALTTLLTSSTKAQRNCGPARRCFDLADGAAHQAGNPGEARQHRPFLPHLPLDLSAQLRRRSQRPAAPRPARRSGAWPRHPARHRRDPASCSSARSGPGHRASCSPGTGRPAPPAARTARSARRHAACRSAPAGSSSPAPPPAAMSAIAASSA